MRFGLLGPLEVFDDSGAKVAIGGRQQRLVLSLLLLAGGRPVAVDTLVDAIWGEAPSVSATGALQSYVSRLRRCLDGPGAQLVFDDAGYRLEVEPDQVDFRRFERLADEGRALLEAGRPAEARDTLESAEALWRGPALVELADLALAVGLAARLEERRLAASEDRIAAEQALGRHAIVVAELTELVVAHPLREGLRYQLAVALYRSGRQAEALRALADAARTLRDELGIEPSRPLRELESAILAHDPALDSPGAAAPVTDGGTASAASGRPPLVGRDVELAQLLSAFDESAAQARFVVIEGEPGIGKTRLAEELRVRSAGRGAVAVWGRADEGGAAPALWPWLPPLRALATLVGSVPDALAELLAGEASVAAGQAAAMQFERFEAVVDLLDRAAAAAPVVVLLDDLQWADTTSLELLAHLARRSGAGLLVIGTMRQLEVGRNDAVTDALSAVARRQGSRRLQLRGLTGAATTEMLNTATVEGVAADVAAAIHARAEGNPFYSIELARLVGEEGGIDGEVPGSVGDVIRRRLTRLPTATVELLGVAAVTGRDVDLDLLARSADLDVGETLDALEPAVVHRLLVDVPDRPAVLRFSHALVREVLLDGLTSLRRARLHLNVANAIEATGAGVDDAEILAEHLWRAAPVGVGHRAADALERAAEVSLHRVSYGAAEDLLTKAVQLRRATGSSVADQEAELGTIYRLLEVTRATRYFQGADHDVIGRGKDLAERLGNRHILLKMLWFEWAALATAARVVEAGPLAHRYLEITADDPSPDVRASGHEVFGCSCWGAGRITEAVEHFDTALALLADAPPPVDAFSGEQRLIASMFWALNHALRGDRIWEEIIGFYDALMTEAPDRFWVSSVCGFAGTTAAVLGQWDDLARLGRIAEETDPSSQFAFWGGQLLMSRGILAALRGAVDEGIASFAAGKARYLGLGGRSGLPSFEACLAMNLARQGRIDDATAHILAARAELDFTGERWNEPTVLIGEAVVAFLDRHEVEAAELVRRAIGVATDQGADGLARRAAEVAAVMGVSGRP